MRQINLFNFEHLSYNDNLAITKVWHVIQYQRSRGLITLKEAQALYAGKIVKLLGLGQLGAVYTNSPTII